MSAIETLLGNPISQALGWALINFIWQGALIAILYASVSVLLRRFTANVRYAAACTAMLLMLVAPAVTMFFIGFATETRHASEVDVTQGAETANAITQVPDERLVTVIANTPEPAARASQIRQWAKDLLPRAMPWLLSLWFAGVLFLSLRFVAGLAMVRRLRRAETSGISLLWQERLSSLCRRLRVSRPVRLCESALVDVPTVIGWLRPVILLPASALTGLSAEQLEALLAHELAHIRRYDYLVNLVQTTVETLLFYHPAVWWVSAQVRQEREHCCDDLAVSACGDVLTYARALTALEQMRACEPLLACAATGGSLLVRIQRLIRGRAPGFSGPDGWLAGFIAVATVVILLAGAQAALLTRNAKAAVVRDAPTLIFSESPSTSAAQTADKVPRSDVDQGKGDKAIQPVETLPMPDAPSVVQAPADLADSQTPAQVDKPSESHDFISEMASVGLANLTIDQLVALKTQGVTTEFVRDISAIVSHKLTADEVVAMKIHGINSTFANEFKALGLLLNTDELVAFRIHGVTPQFINEMKSTGLGNVDSDSLVAFRIHGVTPAFVQQMKDFGFAGLSGDELIAFRIHGVTPLFIQTMRTYIRGKLSADELVALRIHGVTSEMIKELEIIGYANLSADRLTAFSIHGVTPAFIKSIQEAGFTRITADQLTELRIFGVTPEFIQTVRSRGFADATLDQLVELRRLNILPSRRKD